MKFPSRSCEQLPEMVCNKRATPKWVTKSCDNRYDEVCGWNSIKDMASCLVFNPFWEKFELDLWPSPKVKVIGTWVIECALLGCTLVPSMKCVEEIASKIWPVLCFFMHFWENLTLTFDLDLGSRSSALGPLTSPYWVVPWYQVWSL